jgi:hypothetical protein
MKRISLLAAFLLIGACATGSGDEVSRADIEMFQLVGPADLGYPSGEIEIKFGLRIGNPTSEAITLRQVELVPVGLGGPYEVIRRTYYFSKQVIEPNQGRAVSFWAKADAEGDSQAADANAPVALRAIAVFDSPSGSFRKVLMKTFTQRGTGPTSGQ